MPDELLSICIPTRNRARFLRDILTAFAQQVADAHLGPDQVVFYISDNAAEDETPEIIRGFAKKVPWAVCSLPMSARSLRANTSGWWVMTKSFVMAPSPAC
jgi:glycosyltransferase involved in cell wall biosynthesis